MSVVYNFIMLFGKDLINEIFLCDLSRIVYFCVNIGEKGKIDIVSY